MVTEKQLLYYDILPSVLMFDGIQFCFNVMYNVMNKPLWYNCMVKKVFWFKEYLIS